MAKFFKSFGPGETCRKTSKKTPLGLQTPPTPAKENNARVETEVFDLTFSRKCQRQSLVKIQTVPDGGLTASISLFQVLDLHFFTHKPPDLANEYERFQGLRRTSQTANRLLIFGFTNITSLHNSHTATLSPHFDEDEVTVQS